MNGIYLKNLFLIFILAGCGSSTFTASDGIMEPQNSQEAKAGKKKGGFNSSAPSSNSGPARTGSLPEGVYGGHFDVDTFDGDNNKLAHVHEFDDKYQTNGIVFFGNLNFDGKGGLEFDDGGASVFKLRLVNAEVSKSAVFRVNGKAYSHGSLPDPDQLYSIRSNAGSGVIQVTEMSFTIDEEAIINGSFSSSVPGCVQKDTPGPQGQKRNGAFTLEVLDRNNNIVWEISIYEHGDTCWGFR